MPWAKLIFIGTATNLDNMGIGVAYGLKRKAIPFLYNLIIAFISALVTFFAVISGGWLRQYISQNFADLSGGILIIFLGLYTLWQSRASATDPALQTLSTTETMSIISWQESIVLGFTLSINCIGIAFGEGIAGNSPWLIALSVGIFAIATLEAGVKIGSKVATAWIDKYSALVSALLLIGIGFYELLPNIQDLLC